MCLVKGVVPRKVWFFGSPCQTALVSTVVALEMSTSGQSLLTARRDENTKESPQGVVFGSPCQTALVSNVVALEMSTSGQSLLTARRDEKY